jgi:LysR family transcriptional regulator, hydrogen peroxide-inducible genes activator
MELHQIRYFLAVEDARNFSRAAANCNITQPALTRAIQKLEDDVGGRLFNRNPGRVELTELGRLMLPRFMAALSEVTAARSQAHGLLRSRKQRLRLGVMCTIGPNRLIALIGKLNASIEHLELELVEAKGSDVIQLLLADEIDAGLVGLPQYNDAIECLPLYEERYVLAVPKTHRFAGKPSTSVDQLNRENYIERLNCEFDDHFAAIYGEWPVELNVRYRSEREDWVQAMVSAGLGIAIIPGSFDVMAGIATAALVDPVVTRTISVVTMRGRPRSLVAAQFISIVKATRWQQPISASV